MSYSNREQAPESQPADAEAHGSSARTHRVRDDESVTAAVVRVVSAESHADQTELEPLYSAIDPDALNALFTPQASGRPRRTDPTVSFDYGGRRVRISSDGTIEVD